MQKNKKRDGSHYDIYTDGLKVYTTIDSRMQEYAEKAVYSHVALRLQPEFDKRKYNENFPFNTSLSSKQVKRIFDKAMRQSERYQAMKAAGASEEDIHDAFCTLTPMSVYTYHGDVDTGHDTARFHSLLQDLPPSRLVSIDPSNGYVKAYVGGLNYAHFQYDMGMIGRRQIGST